MANLDTTTVTTFQEYLEQVDQDQNGDLSSLWYRGVGKHTHKLTPSIFRNSAIDNSDKLFDVEKKLITRFEERSVPYLQNKLDPWELLFLMQHYGMPTRLLDWTENPLIALFFALSSARKNDAGIYDQDAAVWVLSPSKWNQFVFSHQSYQGGAMSPSELSINGAYGLKSTKENINEIPAAILGIHNSPRIVAQRGSFCIFGKSLDPMEDIFSTRAFDNDALKKLIIPANSIAPLLNKIIWMGITDSVIYPGLEGLARETKRQFGYEV